jgi:TatD DNase family protein
MSPNLVDTHCHLNFNAFDDDRYKVVERARQAGVKRMLNPGVDLPSSQAALELADEYPEVYAAVGVHPNDGSEWDDSTEGRLQDLIAHPKVVAIGEIGLDYYRDRTPKDTQRSIFNRQLELAAEAGLPVVIHTRNASPTEHSAMDGVLEVLEGWLRELDGTALAARPGVLHAYSDDLTRARRAIELGFRIGIGGPVTFKNAPVLQEVVASLPLEYMLIETDAPFLTPHPHRGKRNEPAYTRLIAEQVAHLQGCTAEEVENTSTESAARLFQW